MPTYEYRCRSCGTDLEAVQSFDDDPLTTCPECGGPLRKVFGSVGIAFKGSGFYKTDSRSGTKSRSSGSAGSGTDSSGSSDSSGTSGDSSSKPADSSSSGSSTGSGATSAGAATSGSGT